MTGRAGPDPEEGSSGLRIQFVPTVPHSLQGSLLVIGVPTHGLAASIATHYLVRSLEMPHVAHLDGSEHPPTISVDEGPVRPLVVCGPEGKCDRLAMVSSDIQPPAELLRPVARTILARAQTGEVGLVVVLEGSLAEEEESEQEVAAAANVLGQPIPRVAGVGGIEGSITGFTGALFLEGIGRPIPAVGLVVRSRKSHPDARAAARLIEPVRRLIPKIPIDADPLRGKAEESERATRTNLPAQSRSMESLRTTPPSSMYG